MSDYARTLILLKPDAVRRGLVGQILARIEAKGYELLALDLREVEEAILAQHYAEHVERPFYPSIVEYMTSGPLVALVVGGHRVVEGMRSLMGSTEPTLSAPGTIRGDFGRDWGTESMQNLIHGSDSEESAAREIAIWFPEL